MARGVSSEACSTDRPLEEMCIWLTACGLCDVIAIALTHTGEIHLRYHAASIMAYRNYQFAGTSVVVAQNPTVEVAYERLHASAKALSGWLLELYILTTSKVISG